MQTNILNDPLQQRTPFSTINCFPKESMIDEKDFLQFLTIKQGISNNSIRHCMIRIRIINKWLESNELTKESIERFFMELKNKGLKNNSLNTYKFVLGQLVEYCKDRNLPSSFLDGFKSFKKTKSDIIILTPDEIEKIINTPLQYGKRAGIDCSFLDLRNRTLTSFLAMTGCRPSEAFSLKIKHLDLSAGRAVLIETKTNENRSVYFSDPLKANLSELIKGFNEENLVFRNSKEHRINDTDFNNDLRKRAKAAGIIKRVNPYIFRHSFATQLLIEGVDVAIVSKALGHKDVRTTVENYLHLADETIKNATYMHPLNRKNLNPYFILKLARESIERLHFEKDGRFKQEMFLDDKIFRCEIRLN